MKKLLLGTYVRKMVTYYAGFTIIGALILMLPLSIQEGKHLSFVDAVFISASGMSTTGLSTVNISQVLSRFGQVVLALILQFGGVGLMLIMAGLWLMFGKKISLRERTLIKQDQNQLYSGGILRVVKETLFLILYIEFFGFIILAIHFYFRGYFSLSESLFQSFFLTISLFTNAGFDITGDSLIGYNHDYFVLSLSMVLIYLGGIGFFALIEFKRFIYALLNKEKFKFSLYVKIVFMMHFYLVIGGAIIIAYLEKNHFLMGKSQIESIFYCLFTSLTTRNAGFSVVDISSFTKETMWLLNGLMFIGASPNSTGGGIRTTTFLVILATLYSFSTGRKQVIISKRSVKENTILKCLMVYVGATLLIFISTWLISLFNREISSFRILFEVFSAFGTTGLSFGITSSLSFLGKIVLIIDMFIGRVGILSFLLFFNDENPVKNRIKYPEFEFMIG